MQQDTVVQESSWFRSVLLLVGMNDLRFQRIVLAALACLAVPMLTLADNADPAGVGTRKVEGLARDIACPPRPATARTASRCARRQAPRWGF
jgi:hypothetical protein